MGLDEFIDRDFIDRLNLDYLKKDMESLGYLEDFEEWLTTDEDEFEFWIDYDVNFDVDRYYELVDMANEEDLTTKIEEVLDEYGLTYGDVVDYPSKNTIRIVGCDPEEYDEVASALYDELELEANIPSGEEGDDEITVLYESLGKNYDEDNFDYKKIKVGDYVDFGGYGKLYVCRIDADKFRVTDNRNDRLNPNARGWNIKKDTAEGIIEESLKEDTKRDLYVNGKYAASSNKYKSNKDFANKVKKDGKVTTTTIDGKVPAGMEKYSKTIEIKPEDKVRVKKSKDESLKEDKNSRFVVYVPSQNGYIMEDEITTFKKYASIFDDNNKKSIDALKYLLKVLGLKKSEIKKDYEDVPKSMDLEEAKERKYIKTRNSCVDAVDLADELEAQDIKYELENDGLSVDAKDYNRAMNILCDLEANCDESLKEDKEKKASKTLWTNVCSNRIDAVKKYFENGGKTNLRYNRFDKDNSLIMGALRNGNTEMVELLKSYGETILPSEKQEYKLEIKRQGLKEKGE